MSKDIASRFDEIAKKLIKARKSSPGADVHDTQSSNRAYKTLSKSLKKHGKELKDASPKQQDVYNKVIRDTFDFVGNDKIDIEFYQKEMLNLLHKVSALTDKDGDEKITKELKDIIKAQIHAAKKDKLTEGISKTFDVASLAFFHPGAVAGLHVAGEKLGSMFKGGLFSSSTTNSVNGAEARGQADKDLMKEGIDTNFEKDLKHDRIEKQLHKDGDTHTSGRGNGNSFGTGSGVTESSVKNLNVENLIVKNFTDGSKSGYKVPPKSTRMGTQKKTIHPTEEGFSKYKTKSTQTATDVTPNPLKLSTKIKPKYDKSDVTDVEPKIKPMKLLGNSTPMVEKIKAAQEAVAPEESSLVGDVATGAAAVGLTGLKTVAAGAAAIGGGMAIDYGAGKLGIGKNDIDENRDEANWSKMSLLEKAQSGSARTIEHAGSFLGLGNIANEARSNRVEKETNYFNKKEITPTPIDVDMNVERMKKDNNTMTKNIESDMSQNVSYSRDSVSQPTSAQPIVINNNNASAPAARNPEPTGRPATVRHSDSTFKRWQDNSFFA